MRLLRRHVGAAIWTGVVVPPAASLMLCATMLIPATTWANPASVVPSFLALFFIFALPVGYVFGGIPALLAGAIYSGALSAMPTAARRPLPRAALGAACGGLMGAIWFYPIVGPGWSSHATAGTLVMALFALRRKSMEGAIEAGSRQRAPTGP